MGLKLHDRSSRAGSGHSNPFRKLCFTATLIGFAGMNFLAKDSQATIISLFNFNDMTANNNGTTAATIDNAVGTPMLTLVEDSGLLADLNGQGGTSFADEEGTLHASGQAAAWTAGILNTSLDPSDTWLLELNTVGYHNLRLRFDYRLTDSVFQGDTLLGPRQLTMEWAASGGGFNTIQTFNLNRDNAYNEFTLDLSGIGALQDTTDVKLRGTWSNDGSETIPGGTFPSVRMDNLQVTGVPEPASVVLLACGLAALATRRRW
jgi:hypothetical protein